MTRPASGRAVALALGVACAVAASAPGRARADAAISEAGFGLIYELRDGLGVGLDGFAGLELGEPILGAFYLEPLLRVQIDLTGSSRVMAVLRANFVAKPGKYFSIGFGVGEGNRVTTDEATLEDVATPMRFRTVELGFKSGGKFRFGIDLAIYFDHISDDGTDEGTAFVLRGGWAWASGL